MKKTEFYFAKEYKSLFSGRQIIETHILDSIIDCLSSAYKTYNFNIFIKEKDDKYFDEIARKANKNRSTKSDLEMDSLIFRNNIFLYSVFLGSLLAMSNFIFTFKYFGWLMRSIGLESFKEALKI